MAYVVFGYGPNGTLLSDGRVMEAARVALQRAVEKDGRFSATLTSVAFAHRTRHLPQGWSFNIERVRLRVAKPYCGQHPGPCEISPFLGARKKPRATYLEWDDWVSFHEIVNDVLDRLEIRADAWTNPQEPLSVGKKFWIRRDNKRRVKFDWDEQYRGGIRRPVRVWNAGTPDQFEPASLAAVGGAR